MTTGKRNVLIVGGVAGGASAAARARRLSEDARIVIFERGPHVSFANCGLPYFIGGEITDQQKLLLQTPKSLADRFRMDVRVNSEVVGINRHARTIEVRDLVGGRTYVESYDDLIIATGASPLKPPIPGIDRQGHFVLRNVPDTLKIDQWISSRSAKSAVVVGGGYVGLEMAEQLHRRGLRVAIAEALPQVMAPLDPEMAAMLHAELRKQGVELHLNDAVASFDPPGTPNAGQQAMASVVTLKSGARMPADLVILGLGVRPEAALAKQAGLEIGERGGIRVNDRLQTSDPNIWAVGDAIEVRDVVTGQWSLVPLAGPANRQGRLVADNIFGGSARYAGTQGTAVIRLFDLTAACTGSNEKTLKRAGIACDVVHLHPASHAGYYPGAQPIALKLIFSPADGRILGAQAVGRDGVDKRMDVIATALKARMTVEDLAELELCYAPPFGSAKDPVNLAGMAASNVRAGMVRTAQWHEVASLDPACHVILDVRTNKEFGDGAIPTAIHIPLDELRDRLGELPRDKALLVHCQSGQRSYYACRILTQHGFDCRNLTGSYKTWSMAKSC